MSIITKSTSSFKPNITFTKNEDELKISNTHKKKLLIETASEVSLQIEFFYFTVTYEMCSSWMQQHIVKIICR